MAVIYSGPLALVGLSAPRVWPAPSARALPGPTAVSWGLDVYAGDGIVAGDAVNVGPPEQPVARRIRLLDERDGRIVRETWSDADSGAWAFPRVRRDLKYTVLAYDHTGFYNGWMRTGVTADLL